MPVCTKSVHHGWSEGACAWCEEPVSKTSFGTPRILSAAESAALPRTPKMAFIKPRIEAQNEPNLSPLHGVEPEPSITPCAFIAPNANPPKADPSFPAGAMWLRFSRLFSERRLVVMGEGS